MKDPSVCTTNKRRKRKHGSGNLKLDKEASRPVGHGTAGEAVNPNVRKRPRKRLRKHQRKWRIAAIGAAIPPEHIADRTQRTYLYRKHTEGHTESTQRIENMVGVG